MAKESALHEARRRFNEVSQRVRSDGNNWQNFLTCAARNHKYSFQDQLLIFDQRPYATACADFDLWHDRFNRFIEKGTKSVRLLSPDGQSVKHVFDITDTRPGFGHEFDEPPYIWQVDPENLQDVSARLNRRYGASGELGEQISKDYEGESVFLVCILKGAAFFACELAKRITVPVTIDFMAVALKPGYSDK